MIRSLVAVPTTDQIVALAPDAASIKAARELAQPRRWPLLGGDDGVLWGNASGSAATPYQVMVSLGDLATKCTCPSRKLPCKHGLALLLLAAEQPAALGRGERPPFVVEWLESRAERERQQEKRAAKRAAGAPMDNPASAAAQQKRRERRAQRLGAGVDLLRQWLGDVVRSGLAADTVQDEAPWRSMVQRLVDAQAPGLAARVANAGERLRRGSSHALAVMDELGRLHAIVAAARHRDRLTPELAHSLTQALGETVPSEVVLATPGLTDEWFVAGRLVTERDRLVISRTWLLGRASGRWAMVLNVAPVHLRAGEPLPLGVTLQGELCWYPGAMPLRAVFRGTPKALRRPGPAATTFAELLARHAAAVAREPWHGLTPFLVAAQPGELGGEVVLVDADGAALPATLRAAGRALLTAVTGGRPVPVAGVFDGEHVEPLATQDGSEWCDLTGSAA